VGAGSYNRAMRRSARDTAPEAHRVQIELLRRAGPTRRFALAASLTRFAVEASRRELRRRHPEEDERSIALRWVSIHYGEDLADRLRAHLEARER
jgi:hypothetical protein